MKNLINKIDKKAFIILILTVFVFLVGGSMFEDDSDGGLIALVFFLSGPIFYILVATFYSGKDKRHFHERETENIVRNLRQNDNFIKTVTKTKESSIGSITYSNQADFGGALTSKIIKEGSKFLQ